MNSPLSIIRHKLPYELIDIIQSYLRNDLALEAIYYHIQYLYEAQLDHEDEIYKNNKCECRRYFNSRANRWKIRECDFCYKIDYTSIFQLPGYNTCIWNNSQLSKILTTWTDTTDNYYIEYET
jgi:hypothetical protein